eukprot:674434_1
MHTLNPPMVSKFGYMVIMQHMVPLFTVNKDIHVGYIVSKTGCSNLYLDCIGSCYFKQYDDKIYSISNDSLKVPTKALTLNVLGLLYEPNTDIECSNQTNEWTVDNYSEKNGDLFILLSPPINNASGPICCRGSESCKNSNIQYSYPTENALICSGYAYASCFGSHIDVNGSVFCEGDAACRSSTITTKNVVHCAGYYACREAVISSPSSVYCSGSRGCTGA